MLGLNILLIKLYVILFSFFKNTIYTYFIKGINYVESFCSSSMFYPIFSLLLIILLSMYNTIDINHIYVLNDLINKNYLYDNIDSIDNKDSMDNKDIFNKDAIKNVNFVNGERPYDYNISNNSLNDALGEQRVIAPQPPVPVPEPEPSIPVPIPELPIPVPVLEPTIPEAPVPVAEPDPNEWKKYGFDTRRFNKNLKLNQLTASEWKAIEKLDRTNLWGPRRFCDSDDWGFTSYEIRMKQEVSWNKFMGKETTVEKLESENPGLNPSFKTECHLRANLRDFNNRFPDSFYRQHNKRIR